MKFTLIATVYNEEENIQTMLETLKKQTRTPNEVIIVDGGSTDKTREKIEEYKDKLPLKLIHAPGANISQGRNIAIEKASNEVVVATDAGCHQAKDWFEEITKVFEENPEETNVGGFYYPSADNEFQEVIGELRFPKDIGYNFLPSSRNVAYTKEAWRKAGKYPEWLYIGEDRYYNHQMEEKVKPYTYTKDAVVYWHPRKNFKKMMKQYYWYAKGNGESLRILKWPENKNLIAFYLGMAALITGSVIIDPWILPLAFILAPIISFAYGLGRFQDIKKAFYTVLVQLGPMAAHVAGAHAGLWKRLIGKVGPNVKRDEVKKIEVVFDSS